ncbi:MAG TPA: antitoxin [Blastocatellia bacterium]|nr:antitoxin [Blastocatellia bacterium]
MRTTITLEKDVEQLVRDAMHRSRKSFKETLNAAVRAGLAGKPLRGRPKKFIVKARPLGVRSGIDPTSFNKLADDLEVDAFLDNSSRRKKTK